MKKKINLNEQEINSTDLNEIFDKMLKLKEVNKEPSFLKKTAYVVTGICITMFVGLVCITIYKNNLSVESILSTLLAFFSIFISIFFYFKADETSSNFYDSSYGFMKDISVTLGKIEERFGEKLNSINDKMSHLDNQKTAITQEIKDKEEDKDKIINELIEKTNLNKEEKEKYRKEIQEKDEEIRKLRRNKFMAEREATRLKRKMLLNDEMEVHGGRYGGDIMKSANMPELSFQEIMNLRKHGVLDTDGKIDQNKLIDYLKYNLYDE